MRATSCGLSEISKPEVTSRSPRPNVTCMCILFSLHDIFYNLNLNALGGEGRALLLKATRFPLAQPHSLSQVCVPGLLGHLCLTAPALFTHPSTGCRPSVQYFSSGTGSRLLISASIKLFIREPQNCPVPRLTA